MLAFIFFINADYIYFSFSILNTLAKKNPVTFFATGSSKY